MTTLAILKAAREKIVKGWCRGQYERNGKFCAVGAIAANWRQWEFAKNALAKGLPRGEQSVVLFNDRQVTKEPILALYDRAINKLRKKKVKK